MTTHPTASWSEILKQHTREAIEQVPVTLEGRMCFKHPTQGCSYATVDDLCHDRLELRFQNDREQRQFDSVDALLQAGWAVD